MLNFRTEKLVRTNKLMTFLANFRRLYSVRLWVITTFTIVSVQLGAWVLFEFFLETRLSDTYHGIIEITVLISSLWLILFPCVYYFSYRPLLSTIENLKAAQNQLVDLNQELVETNKRENHGRQLREALLLANQAFSQSLSLESTASTFLDFLFDFVPYDVATILIPITHSRWAVLKSISRESGEKLEIDHSQYFDLESLPSLKAVIENSDIQLIADTRLSGEWQPQPELNEMGSWLGLPFKSDGSILGICELFKKKPNFFTTEHLELTEMFVHVATTALHNAMLYEQVRTSQESLQLLSHRLVNVQEQERRYIARELHDEAGQGLASLMVGFRLLEANVNHPEGMLVALEDLKATLNDVSDRLHGLAVRLRPASLDHLGVVPLLAQYVEDFAKNHNIAAQFATIDINGRFPLEVETAIYRMVQEALTNVARHAQATRADVLLHNCGNKLVISIEDNGVGFIPESVNKLEHLGLVGIAERADMLNGNLTVESTPGVGTSLIVEVPNETAHIAS